MQIVGRCFMGYCRLCEERDRPESIHCIDDGPGPAYCGSTVVFSFSFYGYSTYTVPSGDEKLASQQSEDFLLCGASFGTFPVCARTVLIDAESVRFSDDWIRDWFLHDE